MTPGPEPAGGRGHDEAMSDDGDEPTSFRWGGATHRGRVRSHNEDAFEGRSGVCVVADGMGGHLAGEVASRLVTSLVDELFRPPVTLDDVDRAVAAMNTAVRRTAWRDGTRGMGTTIVGAALIEEGGEAELAIFHVGDSRCYRLDDDGLRQLTVDHSHVQQLVDSGLITPAEAEVHPMRNVVTRALGAEPRAVADVTVLAVTPARLLLCTDGLSGELEPARIASVLRSVGDPELAAGELVAAVLDGDASDNVTAVVIDVVPGRVATGSSAVAATPSAATSPNEGD